MTNVKGKDLKPGDRAKSGKDHGSGNADHSHDDGGGAVMAIRYVVRDTDTKGIDFLVWGDDDFAAAVATLLDCLADGLAVELAAMPADAMDENTARLIDGRGL
jgi:hypothetical protein